MRRFTGIGLRHRQYEKIEPLDDESKCYHRDASAYPGKEGSLVGSVMPWIMTPPCAISWLAQLELLAT
jgi:hypothetical protein